MEDKSAFQRVLKGTYLYIVDVSRNQKNVFQEQRPDMEKKTNTTKNKKYQNNKYMYKVTKVNEQLKTPQKTGSMD